MANLNLREKLLKSGGIILTSSGEMEGASNSTSGQSGLVPAPTIEDKDKFLQGNGTWQIPKDTTYDAMEASEATDGTSTTARTITAKVLNDKIIEKMPVDMIGATDREAGKAGLVPAPNAGENNGFLRGDGTWADPEKGFDGYWEAGESVEVGDIRYIPGKENSGYILECVQAGATGSVVPEVSDEDVDGEEATTVTNVNELQGVLDLDGGGTGATTSEQACINLGIINTAGHLVLPGGGEIWIA